MSLKEDINAGLAAIKNPNNPKELVLDKKGKCFIELPMPESVIKLTDGQLVLKIQLAPSERFFSLTSMLATVNGSLDPPFLTGLLNRQFYADRLDGVSIAYNKEKQTLVVSYNWILSSISPEQFKALFKKYVSSTFQVIKEMRYLSKQQKQIDPFH